MKKLKISELDVLYTVLERLMEEKFHLKRLIGQVSQLLIDSDYVNHHLETLADNEDLSRFIL